MHGPINIRYDVHLHGVNEMSMIKSLYNKKHEDLRAAEVKRNKIQMCIWRPFTFLKANQLNI